MKDLGHVKKKSLNSKEDWFGYAVYRENISIEQGRLREKVVG